jgi:hypothetical protein
MDAERLPTPERDVRLSSIRVGRDTRMTAQWNLDGTYLIVTFGDRGRGGIELLLAPHAAKRLQAGLVAAENRDQELRRL